MAGRSGRRGSNRTHCFCTRTSATSLPIPPASTLARRDIVLIHAESRPDLEQSAYVQDLIRLGNWTVSAGLRWDHYQLLVNQNAVSPRLSVARFFPSAGLVMHASYDRVFQTPSAENILLSSSSQVVSLNPQRSAVAGGALTRKLLRDRRNQISASASCALTPTTTVAMPTTLRMTTRF